MRTRYPIEYPTPPDAPQPAPLPQFKLLYETLGMWDAYRLAVAAPRLAKAPKGDGQPVILIPGWQAPQQTMAPLRRFLRSRNLDARHWGLGTNLGSPEADSEELVRRLENEVAGSGRTVALVGWSLGGVIARETARMAPEAVSQVITYGTPVIGGPTFTPAARIYGSTECQRIASLQAELDRERPIQRPITAIFTRRDKLVSWPACIDRTSPQVTHYEVGSTHVSLGFDPDVWGIIAQRLVS